MIDLSVPPEEQPLLLSRTADNYEGIEVIHDEAYLDLRKSLSYDESVTSVYADDESNEDITLGRVIARFLSRFSWYYPNNQDGKSIDTPLDKAWAFFEHQALPRCFIDQRDKNGGFLRAKVTSSDDTMLYPIKEASDTDLGEFGIGVGLYFLCLKFFSVIFFIAGIISIPNMMYFASEDYATGRQSIIDKILKASAICTETSWEPCPTCTLDDWKGFPSTMSRIASTTSSLDGSTLFFIKVNHCKLSTSFGITTFVTMVFIILSVIAFCLLQKKWLVQLDVDTQTSSDYSIRIDNPPKDARDPEVWKEFFESRFDNTHVTLCTVVLDNEDLVELLTKRRMLYRKLEDMLPTSEEFDYTDLASVVDKIPEVPEWKVKYLRSPTPSGIYDQIQQLDEEIDGLSETKFDVSGIFITFETEQAQRSVLQAMSFPVMMSSDSIPEHFRFEGQKLMIQEADEPSSIRWADLDESELERSKQFGISTLLSIALIVGGAILITWAWNISASLFSLIVIVLSLLTPMVVKKISSRESHPNETSYMSSLYLKITLLRWTFTGIIALIITPFAETLQNNAYFLHRIYSLFYAELVTKPILQFLDIGGNIAKHYAGPRAPDQRRMNQKFLPPQVNIGERYTDLTKVLFFAFMFSTIFPPAFFFASAILAVSYWGDKYRLFRCWGSSVKINSEISDFSNYFLLMSLAAYTVITAYIFAEFPFDNVCKTNDYVPSSYLGDHTLYVESSHTTHSVMASFDVHVSNETQAQTFCQQDLFRHGKGSYPPTAADQPEGSQWMSPEQEDFSAIFGWTSVLVVILMSAIVVYKLLNTFILPLFFNMYKPTGEATDIGFSNVAGEVYGYVPMVKVPGYLFPFLLTDVDYIDKTLIGWSGFDTTYDKYNLLMDVSKSYMHKINDRENISTEDPGVFSTVKQWKPSQG